MKHYLLYGLGAAILFALSASVSLWLQHKNKSGDGEAKESPRLPVKSERPGADEQSPSWRERDKALREKEETLNKRQKALDAVNQDVRTERAALEDLRKQIQDELRSMGKKVQAGYQAAPESRTSLRDEPAFDSRRTSVPPPAREVVLLGNIEPEKIAVELGRIALERGEDAAFQALTKVPDKSTRDAALAFLSNEHAVLSGKLTRRMEAASGAAPTEPTPPAVPVPPVSMTIPPIATPGRPLYPQDRTDGGR